LSNLTSLFEDYHSYFICYWYISLWYVGPITLLEIIRTKTVVVFLAWIMVSVCLTHEVIVFSRCGSWVCVTETIGAILPKALMASHVGKLSPVVLTRDDIVFQLKRFLKSNTGPDGAPKFTDLHNFWMTSQNRYLVIMLNLKNSWWELKWRYNHQWYLHNNNNNKKKRKNTQ
jgi:hypothetical protein